VEWEWEWALWHRIILDGRGDLSWPGQLLIRLLILHLASVAGFSRENCENRSGAEATKWKTHVACGTMINLRICATP